MQEDNKPKKLELERKIKSPLTMFLFTVQDARFGIDIPVDVKAIIAYDVMNALDMVKKDYPDNANLIISHRGKVEIKKILNILDIDSPVTKLQVEKVKDGNIEEKVVVLQTEPTKKQFVHNCMLIADTFVTNKNDQKSLKTILSKIKLDELDKKIVPKKSEGEASGKGS